MLIQGVPMFAKRCTLASLFLLPVMVAGCDRLLPRASTVPTAAQADSVFRAHGIDAVISVSGNVVEVSASQPGDQLRRGGALWAKVGPYIYLFSPATSDLFEDYPGLAAVRARTHLQQREIARALLVRDTMRAGEWGQVTSLLVQALREGTVKPSRLEDLVRWGERFTTYRYDPAYVPRDSAL